ncbi:Hypothetical predicted protein [Lecanosticta acicola]|uniref:Uncharacterized protein n=1 Tax=Lecanosticta acicola TaxID=111012 RepID=A0AAI9EFC4_9PEZI|nr:Hypothetical predicted protein [Lecanosticta acicola]
MTKGGMLNARASRVVVQSYLDLLLTQCINLNTPAEQRTDFMQAHWNPKSESELRYLLARELDLDSYLLTLQRRHRAFAPSPEAVPRVSVDSVMPLEDRISSAFRPINAESSRGQHPATREVQSGSTAGKLRRPTSRLEERPESEIRPHQTVEEAEGRRRDSEETVEDAAIVLPQQRLEDRDFPVKSIRDKKDEDGIIERLVEWEDTMHPLAIVYAAEDGDRVMDTTGYSWRIRSKMILPRPNSEQNVLIEWFDTWHPDWEMPKEAVADYERLHHPQKKSDAQENLAPSWYIKPEVPSRFLPPEEGWPRRRGQLPPDVFTEDFVPCKGADYSISFLELLRLELKVENPAPAAPARDTILRFLNQRIRQRFRVLDHFTNKEFRLSQVNIVRACLVYMFGLARRLPCSHCRESGGPFRFCVTLPVHLNGACANCAYWRHHTRCEYHHRDAWYREETLKATSQALPGPPLRPSSIPSSTPQRDDPRLQSSPRSGFNEMSATPLSSPPSQASSAPRPVVPEAVDPRVPSAKELTLLVPGTQANGHGSAESEETGSRRLDNPLKRPFVSINGEDRATIPGTLSKAPKRSPRRTPRPALSYLTIVEQSLAKLETPHTCPKPFRCTDPDVGVDPRDVPPDAIHDDEQFEPGELTDLQVRFIISRCTCAQTLMLQDFWELLLAEEAKWGRGHHEVWRSKERYLSAEHSGVLNALIRRQCRSRCTGEVIDLTGDSD